MSEQIIMGTAELVDKLKSTAEKSRQFQEQNPQVSASTPAAVVAGEVSPQAAPAATPIS